MGIKIGNTDISSIILGPSVQPTTRLPAAYQEVEYIESHGDEYIDSGILPLYGNTYNVNSNFKWTDQDDDIHALFGFDMMSRRFYVGFGYGDLIVNQVPRQTATGTITPNIVTYNTEYYLESEFDTGQMDGSRNLRIFAGTVYSMSVQLYDFKIYENDILLRDFVPCYRKSDGEIGLYDLVDDVFYTNQGSGAFTKGPPLGCKSIKKVYRGSTLIRPSSGGGLLSYQAMVDLGNNYIYDAIDELNAHSQEYYNKYNGDGHLYSDSGFTGLGIANEGFYVFTEKGVMTYAEAMDLFGEYWILVYDGTNWHDELVGYEIPPDDT